MQNAATPALELSSGSTRHWPRRVSTLVSLCLFQVVFKEVEFPAVSFCNLNPIRRSQLYLEENIDLVDVIATLDQATEDQLSGVSSQSSRRRRRRRRALLDDVSQRQSKQTEREVALKRHKRKSYILSNVCL